MFSCNSLSFLKTATWILYWVNWRSPCLWIWLPADSCDHLVVWCYLHLSCSLEFCFASFTRKVAVIFSSFYYRFWGFLRPYGVDLLCASCSLLWQNSLASLSSLDLQSSDILFCFPKDGALALAPPSLSPVPGSQIDAGFLSVLTSCPPQLAHFCCQEHAQGPGHRGVGWCSWGSWSTEGTCGSVGKWGFHSDTWAGFLMESQCS